MRDLKIPWFIIHVSDISPKIRIISSPTILVNIELGAQVVDDIGNATTTVNSTMTETGASRQRIATKKFLTANKSVRQFTTISIGLLFHIRPFG